MLSQVIEAAVGASTVRRVFVVSPERDQIPAPITVLEDRGMGLNAALSCAQEELIVRGYREFVVLPADLPNVQPSDIDHLVRVGRRTGFAVAPDKAGGGTNALFMRSYLSFRFQFGRGSCDAHRNEARISGMDPLIVRAAGLEFDLDTPKDLQRLGWYSELPCLA
jgi:2-phospho-L-lactate guanylyltransferase